MYMVVSSPPCCLDGPQTSAAHPSFFLLDNIVKLKTLVERRRGHLTVVLSCTRRRDNTYVVYVLYEQDTFVLGD